MGDCNVPMHVRCLRFLQDHNANRLLIIGHVKAPTTIEALTYTYDKSGSRITQLRQNAAASNLPMAVAAANIALRCGQRAYPVE